MLLKILILLSFIVLFLFIFVNGRRSEFNSLKIGDDIFQQKDFFRHGNCFSKLEIDHVASIDYYDDGYDVWHIHTENGNVYKLLDYIRGKFIIGKIYSGLNGRSSNVAK